MPAATKTWRRGGFRVGLLGLVLLAGAAEGAFLRNVPQTVAQPDGTVLHLFATGDEYYNRLHDAAGFTIVRDPRDGYLVYAIKVDGRLQPSGLVAGRGDPTAAGLTPDLMPDPRTLPSPEELFPIRERHARVRTTGLASAPAFTTINNLVVFIRFADEAAPTFWTPATYQAWFNSGPSSMENYFLEASYGQLTVSSTFHPAPSETTVVAFQDSHNRSYFKPYNATTNPEGYDDNQRNEREWTLLQAAIDAIAAQVPGSLDLDTNHDGYIDSVVFVVSGSASSGDWSNLLWPHRWVIDDRSYPSTISGKQLGDYNLQLNGNVEVGVLCHEMTHTLGAPDLYHYSSCPSPNTLVPVGRWDLMAEDKDPPQHTTAYLKWRYLGFISAIPQITTTGDYTLNPLTSAANNCYKIASPNSTTEYFVVEYRKPKVFDTTVPGSGLLVCRINTAADGAGDRCGPPDEVYVYRPAGTLTDDGDINHANFSANPLVGRTAINDSTDPTPFLTSGLPGGLSISNIGATGDTISFHVAIQQPCIPGAFTLTSPANGANLDATGSATLSWTPAAGATSYDVYFGSDPGNPSLVGNQTATSVQVPVVANTSYFWRVAAKNACGQTVAPSSGAWAFSVGGTAGQVMILSDGFESGVPDHWTLLPALPETGWGTSTFRSAGGSTAVWCAGGGSQPQSAGGPYVPNMNTWMVYGPFSLADASHAAADFDLWYDTEPNNDKVMWMVSVDGTNFSGYQAWDKNEGWPEWEHVTFDFSDVTSVRPIGAPAVWVAFIFQSNGTLQREGAYIDNVVIKKIVGQPGPEPPRIRRHIPRR